MKYWKHYQQEEFPKKTEYGLPQSIHFLKCNRDKKKITNQIVKAFKQLSILEKNEINFLPVNDIILF